MVICGNRELDTRNYDGSFCFVPHLVEIITVVCLRGNDISALSTIPSGRHFRKESEGAFAETLCHFVSLMFSSQIYLTPCKPCTFSDSDRKMRFLSTNFINRLLLLTEKNFHDSSLIKSLQNLGRLETTISSIHRWPLG